MKRILLSVFSLFIVCLSHANIRLNNVEYTLDTLSMFPAGPGTMYYELRMLRVSDGKGRLDAFLLAVDTRNPYVEVEQVLSNAKIGGGTERPSAMAIRSTTENKIFFAGSNGDFFIQSDEPSTSAYNEIGLPAGTTIVNGEYALTPAGAGGGRRAGGVDADGRGVASYTHNISMNLVLADTVLPIHHANYSRLENELVLYNAYNGGTTGTNAYGTEVEIQLLEGETWNTTGTMKAKVTKVEYEVGSMPLDKGHAVLSGHGKMAAELGKLAVGDEVTLDFEMRLDDEIVNVAQMIGGDHYSAMILDDGVVAQSGYWNELHPRTGFGVSQTRDTVFMLVVDGRRASVGCTTKVLAEILKHYGAWNAVNWDGGGSSCIYVRPIGPMNNGSDGQERACGNGMFAVANVPEVDNAIVAIAPYMPNYYLPRYGIAAPQFLGYNKYGVLVETNVPDVKLSCAPEVGEILEDGRFLASGETGGKLLATWGDITTELDVRIVTSSSVDLRLDSVLCDALHPYKVEVQGTVGNNTVEVLSEALSWTSSNPSVAVVNEKGEVTGVKNGRAIITGRLGGSEDKLIVDVEVATANQMVWDDFRETASWTLKASPTSYNPQLSVPEDANAPVTLKFTYGSGRNPFVQLTKDSLLYSLPEKVVVPITTDAVLNKAIVMIRANNSNVTNQVEFNDIKTGEENLLVVDVKEQFGTDASIYPLHFLALKMVPTSATAKGERYVTLPGIIEVFTEETTALEAITPAPLGETMKYIKNGSLYIQTAGKTYDVLGAQVHK